MSRRKCNILSPAPFTSAGSAVQRGGGGGGRRERVASECSREIRPWNQSRLSVIAYVGAPAEKKQPAHRHTYTQTHTCTRVRAHARARARNKAVCFAKCYEFRVRKMNKTYHRALVERATVFREHPAAVENVRRERRNRISISREIYTCRERGSRAINSFYSKHLFAIYVPSCEHRTENLFVARRWKFRDFIQ